MEIKDIYQKMECSKEDKDLSSNFTETPEKFCRQSFYESSGHCVVPACWWNDGLCSGSFAHGK